MKLKLAIPTALIFGALSLTSCGGGGAPSSTPTTTPPTVTVDTVVPVITIFGRNPEIVAVGQVYSDSGATAYDAVDGIIDASISVNNPVNTLAIGTFNVVYTVSDNAGNTATATRVVNVVDGLTVHVVGYETGSPLSGARVQIGADGLISTTTNALGDATFATTQIGSGPHDVHVFPSSGHLWTSVLQTTANPVTIATQGTVMSWLHLKGVVQNMDPYSMLDIHFKHASGRVFSRTSVSAGALGDFSSYIPLSGISGNTPVTGVINIFERGSSVSDPYASVVIDGVVSAATVTNHPSSPYSIIIGTLAQQQYTLDIGTVSFSPVKPVVENIAASTLSVPAAFPPVQIARSYTPDNMILGYHYYFDMNEYDPLAGATARLVFGSIDPYSFYVWKTSKVVTKGTMGAQNPRMTALPSINSVASTGNTISYASGLSPNPVIDFIYISSNLSSNILWKIISPATTTGITLPAIAPEVTNILVPGTTYHTFVQSNDWGALTYNGFLALTPVQADQYADSEYVTTRGTMTY